MNTDKVRIKRTGLISAIIILVVAVMIVVNCCIDNENVSEVSYPEVTDETITLVAVGDNLLHMPVVNSGKKADGTYDYSHIFAALQPIFSQSDIAVIGQETVFAGKELGYSGYPLFNSPSDMGKTLVKEGFDVVLHASNHVLDKYAKGVESTLEFWKQYPEITVLGINESQEKKDTVNIIERKGAKLALLNYTYGMNGFLLPPGKEYLVNVIDEEKIRRDAEFAEENAHFTIAFMHWGTEYSTKPDAFQKDLAVKMCNWGVDLIIGAHPHVIEPVEWIEGENGQKMLVYYSLGNFVSRQLEVINLLGGMADVKLRFNGDMVRIDDYSFIPIVTHYNRAYNEFSVMKLSDYSDGLGALHGVAAHNGKVTVERWEGMVEKTFDGYDMSHVALN